MYNYLYSPVGSSVPKRRGGHKVYRTPKDIQCGPSGIAALMRRLLTGYAVSYNMRHKRHGQLFQNRYQSFICQEDAYLQELVRYIHLNPLRAKIVVDLGMPMVDLAREFDITPAAVIYAVQRGEKMARNNVTNWKLELFEYLRLPLFKVFWSNPHYYIIFRLLKNYLLM